jgi:hypothetical protein
VAVADDLVDEVRLGGVERGGAVAQVLRRVEQAVGERAVELVDAHDARGRDVAEARQLAHARRDLLELGDVVAGEVERHDGLVERAAGELLVLGGELAPHGAPDVVLGLRVVDAGRRCPGLPGQRGGGDLVAALLVGGVPRAGVGVGEVHGDRAVVGLRDRGVELGLLEHLRPPRGRRSTTVRSRAGRAPAPAA